MALLSWLTMNKTGIYTSVVFETVKKINLKSLGYESVG